MGNLMGEKSWQEVTGAGALSLPKSVLHPEPQHDVKGALCSFKYHLYGWAVSKALAFPTTQITKHAGHQEENLPLRCGQSFPPSLNSLLQPWMATFCPSQSLGHRALWTLFSSHCLSPQGWLNFRREEVAASYAVCLKCFGAPKAHIISIGCKKIKH